MSAKEAKMRADIKAEVKAEMEQERWRNKPKEHN